MKFKAIRCNNDKPTPYLRENIQKLKLSSGSNVLDLGCGNGRNSKFLSGMGFSTFPFDKKPDFGKKLDLGCDSIPKVPSPSLIICNYVLCFMTTTERKHLVDEINRVAPSGCYLVIELYKAKTSTPYTTAGIRNMFPKSLWETRHLVKDRFILRKR